MESIVIIDMPSRLNKFGGEARIAGILFHKLRRYFKTYYIGFETAYINSNEKNVVVPSSNKIINKNLRTKKISELSVLRFAYNWIIVRGLYGIKKERILETLNQIKPKVIISNSVQDMPLLRFLKQRGINSKLIYIDHGSISSKYVKNYFSKTSMPLTVGSGVKACSVNTAKKKFFNFFDMNIAINKAQYNTIRKFTSKVTYIPNGISVNYKHNSSIEKEIKEKYKIQKKDIVILYVGRMFDRQKNVSTLIKAFMQIKRNAKLLLVGEGPSLKDYTKLAKNDKRIIFTGAVDETKLHFFYNISDIFVIPSFWEGFSISLLEAAAHNMPILLSKDALIKELKEYKIPTFKTSDIEDLKASLLLLIDSKHERELAARASSHLNKYFTEAKMLEGYKALIKKTIKTAKT